MATTPLISYFYLRQFRPIKGTTQYGSHRFSCIAMEKVSSNDVKYNGFTSLYRVSAYVHNPKHGPFNAKYAVTAAVGRLNSERKSTILTDKDLTDIHGSVGPHLFEALHLSHVSRKLWPIGYDNARNIRALNGALKEFEIHEQV